MPIEDTAWTELTPEANDVSAQDFTTPFNTNGPGFRKVRLRRNNGELKVILWAVWGTTSPMGALFTLEFPARMGADVPARMVMPCIAYHAATGLFYTGTAVLRPFSTSVSVAFYFGSGVAQASASVPFTWAQGDWIVAGNAIPVFDN